MAGPDQRPGLLRFTHSHTGIKVVGRPEHFDKRRINAGTTKLVPMDDATTSALETAKPLTHDVPAESRDNHHVSGFPRSSTIVEFS